MGQDLGNKRIERLVDVGPDAGRAGGRAGGRRESLHGVPMAMADGHGRFEVPRTGFL